MSFLYNPSIKLLYEAVENFYKENKDKMQAGGHPEEDRLYDILHGANALLATNLALLKFSVEDIIPNPESYAEYIRINQFKERGVSPDILTALNYKILVERDSEKNVVYLDSVRRFKL